MRQLKLTTERKKPMLEEATVKESELEPDDLFSVESLEVKCPSCEAFCKRQAEAVVDPQTYYATYTYTCSKGCSDAVTLKLPRSEKAERSIPPSSGIVETELEPDDGFTIAQLDVLYRTGPYGYSLLRIEKEVEGLRTVYFFVPEPRGGWAVQIIVPHA